MEENIVIKKENEVKETSIFSFLEGLFRLFGFGGNNYSGQSCQIDPDDLSDDDLIPINYDIKKLENW